MIALYDHIHELRAELRGCIMTRRERAIIEAQLAAAVAQHAALDRAAGRHAKVHLIPPRTLLPPCGKRPKGRQVSSRSVRAPTRPRMG
jgi:hypothetical protein